MDPATITFAYEPFMNIVGLIAIFCMSGIVIEFYRAKHPVPCPRCQKDRNDDDFDLPSSGHPTRVRQALETGAIFPSD